MLATLRELSDEYNALLLSHQDLAKEAPEIDAEIAKIEDEVAFAPFCTREDELNALKERLLLIRERLVQTNNQQMEVWKLLKAMIDETDSSSE